MNATATAQCATQIAPFLNILSRATSLTLVWSHLFRLYYLIVKLAVLHETQLRLLQELSNSCNATCDDPQKCVADICDTATYARDLILDLRNRAKKSRRLLPFRSLLERIATDWDDFVEGCAIAADSDINDLLSQLADAA